MRTYAVLVDKVTADVINVCFCSFVMYYEADRFYVVAHLFSNRSQKTSKCGKNISDTRLKNSQFLWHTLAMAYVNIFCFSHILVLSVIYSGQEKPRSDFLSQVNFALGQVKIEVQRPGGQVKLQCSLSSLVSLTKNANLINDNFQSFHFKT